jgi:hypothetical protein
MQCQGQAPTFHCCEIQVPHLLAEDILPNKWEKERNYPLGKKEYATNKGTVLNKKTNL